ncbi:transporter, cpa2 family protein [Nitzschia inconspicua]|uniref:Transporter, cpa2 family protein n=1 Tax=Nitzschia inconspicua TaxID=303405 RepID=A0A9K3KQD6_9STRA|nr:transporter, cpa2 family protein [Nitzschia inconspicua]
MFFVLLCCLGFVSLQHRQFEEGVVQSTNRIRGLMSGNGTSVNSTPPVIDITTESLSVDVSFEDIFRTVVFLMASWMMALLSQLIGLPSLVGEIVTGFVLGPPLLDFVPYPQAMVLIGSFGLIGLLLDSGINLDIAQLRETGTRAVSMAVTGTLLALGVGLSMGYLANDGDFRSSFAIGAAFAPSSFGVASQVLSKGEVLNTPMGQVIVATSVIDDILGLILLSIMEVLVMDTPRVFDYIIPFLSSFGYLLLLGFVGIKIIPPLFEQKILPKVPEDARGIVAFSLLFIILTLYLPLMYYSGASYLTGAFLAGLSFSQINSVHSRYLSSGHHLKIWLMRLFFASTIGFQVPVQYFTDGNVLNWGFLYMIPVLAKVPLGLQVPRFSKDIPEDFPYNPYRRDVLITTLAMLCRGEFNFIVASFALSAGVLDPEQYAAVVFAILCSAIVAPLALFKIIRYYNNKFMSFLEGKHKLDRIDNTNDGTRPLFLAIQARTPVQWGMQEKFLQVLDNVGLIVIDHRSFHTLGLNAVDVTEIFCQDKLARIRVREAFTDGKDSSSTQLTKTSTFDESPKSPSLNNMSVSTATSSRDDREQTKLMLNVEEKEKKNERREIDLRKQIVRDALVDCLGQDVDESSYVILVSQWEMHVIDDGKSGRSRHAGYCYVTPSTTVKGPLDTLEGNAASSFDDCEDHLPILPSLDVEAQQTKTSAQQKKRNKIPEGSIIAPAPRLYRRSVSLGTHTECTLTGEPKLDLDLWTVDKATHKVVNEGAFMAPVDDLGSQAITVGCGDGSSGGFHHRCTTEGNSALMIPSHRRTSRQDALFLNTSVLEELEGDIEALTIKDRLHGFIRN